MLFLVALSQFLYTFVVLGLVLFRVIPYSYIELNDLGAGNTPYMLLYMGVYIVMMGAPLPAAALILRRRIQPFGPAKKVHPLAFAGGVLGGMAMCVVANIIASYIMTFLQMLGHSPAAHARHPDAHAAEPRGSTCWFSRCCLRCWRRWRSGAMCCARCAPTATGRPFWFPPCCSP